MMVDKKIAVHVTNEEQWNAVKDYYNAPNNLGFKYYSKKNTVLITGSDGGWDYLSAIKEYPENYELLEFNEWQARVKGDNMEKIEVPQAVYDDFKLIDEDAPFGMIDFLNSESFSYPNLLGYLCQSNYKENRTNRFNIAKVMAGEAEFVPIEEAYYWQDKQGHWLGYFVGGITIFSEKYGADKLTESEIRDKTSFDTDKLKKVSE